MLRLLLDLSVVCGWWMSVVLMKPEKQLTADKVFNVFPSDDFDWYDYSIEDREDVCRPTVYVQDKPLPSFRLPVGELRKLIIPWFPVEERVDIFSMFKAMLLKIITNVDIRQPCSEYPKYPGRDPVMMTIGDHASAKERVHLVTIDKSPLPAPVAKPKESKRQSEGVRAYCHETWIWELVSLGDSGTAEIHHKAPDTITDWTAGAVCMGPIGFGMSPSSSLRVFQPFFVDLTLPYSVVRGETFTLKASVFNYLKQCIKVRTTLQTTEELEEQPCDHCQYSSCICADESKTFYWNLKAAKLGEVNITVKTETLDTKELCGNEIPVVPKQRQTDTIVKSVLVRPGGVLVEKSHSSMICINEGGQPMEESVSLKIPDYILKDSARADITLQGDLLSTAMRNLDRLVVIPYGAGEQNLAYFAPNIFILQYLEKTHQLNSEIQSRAKNYLEGGYQHQLRYKHDDGSYSAFGKHEKEGNSWSSS